MQIKTNTQCITKAWSQIFDEGLWTFSSRFMQTMSWGATITLLVKFKCDYTNQYQSYREWTIITMLDIKQPKQVL